jgi:hypothetical protein
MKKPLTLSLFAARLVLFTTGPAVVRLDDRYPRSGTDVTCQSSLRRSYQS